MTPKAAHQKGKRYERYLLDYFKQNVDGHARVPVGSGNGVDKGDIQLPQHNIVIEAKNHKALKIINWWEQAVSQAFNEIPVLIFRNPKKAEFQENLVMLSLEDFTTLLTNTGQPAEIETTLSYSQRSALTSLKTAITRVMKEIPTE